MPSPSPLGIFLIAVREVAAIPPVASGKLPTVERGVRELWEERRGEEEEEKDEVAKHVTGFSGLPETKSFTSI